MRKTITIILCAVGLSLQAEVLSLQQCIDTALVNSLQLRQQSNQYEMARLQLTGARAAISPSVSGNIGQGFNFGRSTTQDNIKVSSNSMSTSFNLSGSILLFDGLAMKYRIDEAKANLLSSGEDMEALELSIRLNVSNMYLQVLLAKKQLEAAKSQLEDTRRLLHRDSALVAAQRKAEGELLDMLAQEASNMLSVQQAESNELLALLDLAQVIDLTDFRHFDIVVPADDELLPPLLPAAEDVYHDALLHRPEIRSLEHQIEAADIALKRSKSAYSPSISASAGVGSNYIKLENVENGSFGQQLADNVSPNVGINMQIPIYDRMQTPLQVKTQKKNAENTRLRLEEKKKSIRKEIDQAFYNAQNAYAERESAIRSEARYKEALHYAKQKYEAGRCSSFEYTTAQNNYLTAQITRLRAEYNYLFRCRILDYYRGVINN